jgi:hypothetical protein
MDARLNVFENTVAMKFAKYINSAAHAGESQPRSPRVSPGLAHPGAFSAIVPVPNSGECRAGRGARSAGLVIAEHGPQDAGAAAGQGLDGLGMFQLRK